MKNTKEIPQNSDIFFCLPFHPQGGSPAPGPSLRFTCLAIWPESGVGQTARGRAVIGPGRAGESPNKYSNWGKHRIDVTTATAGASAS